ncbi:MAG: IS701 family transposase [Chloroflexota bacterium]
MEAGEFARVAASFAAFHQEFAPLFGRREAQERSEQYIRGLLVQQTDRRNAENVAECIEGATPRALQRLLTEAPWSIAPVIARLQTYLGPRLNTTEGVFVLDESGFPKQGQRSVGVSPQYCGVLGKVANCQMGVFLAYASARGHALVDTRLFLPDRWTKDAARCRAAGVPADVTFQSKAALGLVMLRQARALGQLQGCRVTADDAYGEVPSLRDALDAEGWEYVLEVPRTTSVFPTLPALVVPEHPGRGRRYTVPRLAPGAAPAQAVAAVAANLAPAAWQDLTVAEGAQGPRTYQFVARRVWESRDGLPGRACWLLLRRNLDGSEPRFYLANLPPDTALLTLAQIAAARWVIETDFQTAKGETGLDEYEVRSWQGWHHHITLALLAAAFLLTLQQDWGGKYAPDHPHANQSPAPHPLAAPPLHRPGVAPLAHHHPSTQRARQTLPLQTPPRQAA